MFHTLTYYFFPGVSPRDQQEQFEYGIKAQAELQSLYEQACADLVNKDWPPRELTTNRRTIERIRSLIYHVNLLDPFSPPNDEQFLLLQMCANKLPEERILDSFVLKNIDAALEDIKSLAASSQLHSAFGTAITNIASLAAKAVDRYSFHGHIGFNDAYREMVAEFAEAVITVREDRTTTAAQNDVAISKLQKFLGFWRSVWKYLKPALPILALLPTGHSETPPSVPSIEIYNHSQTNITDIDIAPTINFTSSSQHNNPAMPTSEANSNTESRTASP